ncbi:MAG: HNH endonuclease signature motif containing protein [Chitinophagales bacterium]
MFPKNLNSSFNYTLKGKTYFPTRDEIRLIYDKSVTKDYWKKQGVYAIYKSNLKIKHYFGQNRRCAYCRTRLRADAYWEDLDHVVAQSEKGNWIFYPKNLIVTCEPCNRLKNDASTLTNPAINYFPLHSSGFNTFNPHFDKWSDHFEIVKGIFLKGKQGTKGPNTYKHCQLFRPDIIIDYVDEQRIWSIFTMRILTHALKEVVKGSVEEQAIQNAISHMINRKKNN